MAMMFPLSVLVFFMVSMTDATVYKDCGSTAAKLLKFDIPTCPDGSGPCSFKKGTNVTLNVQLTPSQDIDTVTTNLYGIIAGIKTPFISKEDGCKSSVKCPLKANVQTTYTETIFVQQAYPKIRLVADLEVKTSDGKLMICAQFPAEITD